MTTPMLESFREIATDLCEPIDENLPLELQYELNESKAIYLNNLHQECFRLLNHSSNSDGLLFSQADLQIIRDATLRTQEQLRKIIFKSLQNAFNSPENVK